MNKCRKLFRSGQLGEASQPLRTAWFYMTLYFGRRGRENQRKLTNEMLVLQTTPQGKRYYELRRDATKNHQGGLNDPTDKLNGKIFEVMNSSRCPAKAIENFLRHLKPKSNCLFQRPRKQSGKFKPENETMWFCKSPVGESTLASMMKTMSTATENYSTTE